MNSPEGAASDEAAPCGSQSKIEQLKSALAGRGLAPQKIFGQNFMLDTNFAAAVARDAAPDEQTLIIEIGPGTGCLSQALLDAHPQARILAVEIDRGLAALLRDTFSSAIAANRFTLIEGDALAGKHEISPELISEALAISSRENRPRRVLCSNLPYNAATPVLANLAIDKAALGVSSAIATIQLELAERMLAKAGDESYGALSALMGLRARGKITRRVGNAVFWPRPKVDSAVLRLDFLTWGDENDQALRKDEAAEFQEFIKRIFSQRRKTLRALLKPAPLPPDVPANARAEELSPLKILALFRNLRAG
jgi:16S rRNA (adenine1518-N6/adenine1519-N6)-dimethyltransferase